MLKLDLGYHVQNNTCGFFWPLIYSIYSRRRLTILINSIFVTAWICNFTNYSVSRGEHLAVRNAEGSFYLCQASQNIYRHSRKIKIQWLGLTTENNPDKDLYIPEYYDTTGIVFNLFQSLFWRVFNLAEFETILTSVELEKKDKKTFKLEESENQRINKILQKAVDKETGKLSEDDESLTEDNPDGRKSNSI